MRIYWGLPAILSIIASVLTAGIASANEAAGAETRVWAFDLADQARVGAERALTLELLPGCAPTYDEIASDSLLAARGGAKIGSKITKQMGKRGWTKETIDEAIKSGKQIKAVNKATGNLATRYVHPTTGQSVVVDNVTGEVIHVGGPGFKYGPGSGDLK